MSSFLERAEYDHDGDHDGDDDDDDDDVKQEAYAGFNLLLLKPKRRPGVDGLAYDARLATNCGAGGTVVVRALSPAERAYAGISNADGAQPDALVGAAPGTWPKVRDGLARLRAVVEGPPAGTEDALIEQLFAVLACVLSSFLPSLLSILCPPRFPFLDSWIPLIPFPLLFLVVLSFFRISFFLFFFLFFLILTANAVATPIPISIGPIQPPPLADFTDKPTDIRSTAKEPLLPWPPSVALTCALPFKSIRSFFPPLHLPLQTLIMPTHTLRTMPHAPLPSCLFAAPARSFLWSGTSGSLAPQPRTGTRVKTEAVAQQSGRQRSLRLPPNASSGLRSAANHNCVGPLV